jgi:Cellulase (glycosyl hydrolase family 5)
MTVSRILFFCCAAIFSLMTWGVGATTNRQLLLGRGVNLELWGLHSRQGTPSERIDRAKAAGFTFLRLGISVTPWLADEISRLGHPVPAFMQGDTAALKAKSLDDLSAAISHARAEGMKPLVALFVIGTRPALNIGDMLCDIPSGQQAFQAAFSEVLARIPDAPDVAIEPLNEAPGGCPRIAAAGEVWLPFQWQLYRMVRKEKPHITFVVTAGNYELPDGLLSFDPTPYLDNKNAVMSIHYYEPQLFTCQDGACQRRAESFARDIPWPVDEARLAQARDESFRALDQATLKPFKLMKMQKALAAAFDRYRYEGTRSYLSGRFQQLADWASRYNLNPERILIGEFGVHRPTDDTTGSPIADAGPYLAAVRSAAESHHFSWAIWDLDGAMAFLCGTPPNEEVCPSYRSVMATRP